MSCQQPGGIIPKSLADDRVNSFLHFKKGVLDQAIKPVIDDEKITYPVAIFQALLELFAGDSKGYNGIRVYFASYVKVPGSKVTVTAEMERKMALIYVPTLPAANYKTGIDDLSKIYTIVDSQLVLLPNPNDPASGVDTATPWIRYYRDKKIPALTIDGASVSDGFRETRSLWYNMSLIRGDGLDVGLIWFLNCMRFTPDDPSNPVDYVIAKLACFLSSENEPDKYPVYQLSLVFELHQLMDTRLSFGSASLSIKGTDADTGLPCPPETVCNGSGFPNP